MKINFKHIGIAVGLAAILFAVGYFLYPTIVNAVLLDYSGIQYLQPEDPYGRPALFMALAFGLLPALSYLGWTLAGLAANKEKQTFVGVQFIIVSATLFFWFLEYKRQLESLQKDTSDMGDGIIIRISVPINNLKLSEYLLVGVVIGFVVGMVLSGRIKRVQKAATPAKTTANTKKKKRA